MGIGLDLVGDNIRKLLQGLIYSFNSNYISVVCNTNHQSSAFCIQKGHDILAYAIPEILDSDCHSVIPAEIVEVVPGADGSACNQNLIRLAMVSTAILAT
ncbi:hypothetical protein SDC9_143377 [bioreactor metagenome]|uniref:Uncharacterized protein n=1 Tax=bioreactor metagenome TaxID=1076179 RepID=A0A645E3U5_9ZZZZ